MHLKQLRIFTIAPSLHFYNITLPIKSFTIKLLIMHSSKHLVAFVTLFSAHITNIKLISALFHVCLLAMVLHTKATFVSINLHHAFMFLVMLFSMSMFSHMLLNPLLLLLHTLTRPQKVHQLYLRLLQL